MELESSRANKDRARAPRAGQGVTGTEKEKGQGKADERTIGKGRRGRVSKRQKGTYLFGGMSKKEIPGFCNRKRHCEREAEKGQGEEGNQPR